MRQAALMCRKRGRIVLVGVTGLELSRDDFFQKELRSRFRSAYGPGRYDPGYEENGHDYPIGYVRWTEQRNFEAVLDTLAAGRLDVDRLISPRFALDRTESAYQVVGGSGHRWVSCWSTRRRQTERQRQRPSTRFAHPSPGGRRAPRGSLDWRHHRSRQLRDSHFDSRLQVAGGTPGAVVQRRCHRRARRQEARFTF